MSTNFKDPLESSVLNDAYVSKNSDDTKTGKMTLAKPAEGTTIQSVQKSLNEVFDNQGTSEGDVNAKTYATNNKIADNDSQKTCIEKFDVAIQTNETSINSINASIGQPNGICPLDGDQEVPIANLPQEAFDGLSPQGSWDADTNSPDLSALTPNVGDYWVVSVAGSTNLGGITTWQLNDWAIYTSSGWVRNISSEVTSVFSRKGAVTAQSGDYNADQITETATRYFSIKHNRNSSVDPTVNNDSSQNYEVGSTWTNSTAQTKYVCMDASVGAAVWVETGGGGEGGGLDVFYTERFETNAAADFSDTGNGAGLSGGTLQGSLADDESTQIKGGRSITFTQAAGSLNDFFFLPTTYVVEEKEKENTQGITFYSQYDGSNDEIDCIVYDVTNSAVLTRFPVNASTEALRHNDSFYVPSTCNEIKIGFQVTTLNNGAVLRFDEFEGSSNPFVFKNLMDSNKILLSNNGGEVITANTENIVFNGSGTGWNGTNYEYTTQRSDSKITLTGSVRSSANIKRLEVYKNSTLYKSLNGVNEGSFGTGQFSITLLGGDDYVAGDVLSIRTTDGLTLVSSSTGHYLTILEEYEAEHVVTPAKSNLNTIGLEGNDGRVITVSTEDVHFNGTGNGWTSIGDTHYYTVQEDNSIINIKGMLRFTANGNRYTQIAVNGTNYRATSTGVTSVLHPIEYTSARGEFSEGDQISIRVGTTGGTLSNVTSDHYLNVVESKDAVFLNAAPIQKTMIISHEETSGTNGGTFTAGAWQTRPLNTIEGDTELATLSSNQFTLKRGIFDIAWGANALRVDLHRTRLRDITNSISYQGRNSKSTSTQEVASSSEGFARIEIFEDTTFELQHRCSTTLAGAGFGQACSFGENERYAEVKITKVK